MVDVEKDYKAKVIDIWKKFKNINTLDKNGFEYRKSPLLPKYVIKNTILFVGINPSFTKNSIIEVSNREIEFYQLVNNAENEIQYFKKFRNIAEYCNISNWTHLDLFFLRETNQKIIEELSYSNVDFLQEQLNVSFDIIKKATPKIIIVSNSLASEFFGKKKAKHCKLPKIWAGYDLDFSSKNFDKDLGTYLIMINDKKVPILFTSMLSGQRALDIGSFERLKWQVKMILEKMDKKAGW